MIYLKNNPKHISRFENEQVDNVIIYAVDKKMEIYEITESLLQEYASAMRDSISAQENCLDALQRYMFRMSDIGSQQDKE